MSDDVSSVLLKISAQFQKEKAPGLLTISTHEAIWEPEDNQLETKRIPTGSITGQQRAKGKPLLRLNATTGAYVFEFDTIEDRDSVVEALHGLVGKTVDRGKASSETDRFAEPKRRLLSEDKDLREMHENLVKRGVLTETEFWRPRMKQLETANSNVSSHKEQKAGLASVLMPDITIDQDKAQRVKLNLTPEMIHQIFAEQPQVRAAFLEHVPADMDEKEFWLKYCKHEYAVKQKRRKIARGDIQGAHLIDDEYADLFTFVKESKKVTELAKQVDPVINLANDDGEQYEGYGIHHKTREAKTDNQILLASDVVQDINQHSIVVLTGLSEPATETANNFDKVNAKRGRTLDDLEEVSPEKVVHLEIQNIRKRKSDVELTTSHKLARYESSSSTFPECLSQKDILPLASSASQVLQELHCGGELRDDDGGSITRGISPADGLPLETLEELRSKTLIVNELLRHFWASYPVNSSAKDAQVKKLKNALTQQFDSMKQSRDVAKSPKQMALIQQLLKPVLAAINAAIDKYTKEIEIRPKKTW